MLPIRQCKHCQGEETWQLICGTTVAETGGSRIKLKKKKNMFAGSWWGNTRNARGKWEKKLTYSCLRMCSKRLFKNMQIVLLMLKYKSSSSKYFLLLLKAAIYTFYFTLYMYIYNTQMYTYVYKHTCIFYRLK